MKIKSILLGVALLATAFVYINASPLLDKGKKDVMHKRLFKVNQTEVKENQPSKKAIPDEMEFKDGKFFSNLLNEKYELNWMKYDLKVDSLYNNEDGVEVRYVEIEMSHTDKEDQTFIVKFKVEDYEMEGSIKITKKDKLKKMYEFTGKEEVKVKSKK